MQKWIEYEIDEDPGEDGHVVKVFKPVDERPAFCRALSRDEVKSMGRRGLDSYVLDQARMEPFIDTAGAQARRRRKRRAAVSSALLLVCGIIVGLGGAVLTLPASTGEVAREAGQARIGSIWAMNDDEFIAWCLSPRWGTTSDIADAIQRARQDRIEEAIPKAVLYSLKPLHNDGVENVGVVAARNWLSELDQPEVIDAIHKHAPSWIDADRLLSEVLRKGNR